MKNQKKVMAAKVLTGAALLAAMSVVLARLLSFAPMPDTRWSLDKFPIFLAGIFFGPVAGGMVGAVADITGCLLSPYGINPILTVPAILYGVAGGAVRFWIAKKPGVLRLALAYLIPVVLGSILYQSAALAWCYNPAAFMPALWANLLARSIQFVIVGAAEIMIMYALIRTGVFTRLGLWPPKKRNKGRCENDG